MVSPLHPAKVWGSGPGGWLSDYCHIPPDDMNDLSPSLDRDSCFLKFCGGFSSLCLSNRHLWTEKRWYQTFEQMKLCVMVETASSETGGSTPNTPLSTSSLVGARCLTLSTSLSLVKFSLKHLLQRLALRKGDNLESTECIPTQNVSSAKVVPSVYISSNPIRHKRIACSLSIPLKIKNIGQGPVLLLDPDTCQCCGNND